MNSTVNHWGILPNQAVGTEAKDIWAAALRYFEWCDNHPVFKPEMLRAGPRVGDTVHMEVPRPYTLSGLCIHCGLTYQYLKEMANSEGMGDYYLVAQRILMVISAQKEEMGLAGVYNAPLVSRDLTWRDGNAVSSVPVIQINSISKDAPPLLTNEQDIKA